MTYIILTGIALAAIVAIVVVLIVQAVRSKNKVPYTYIKLYNQRSYDGKD